MHFSFKLSALFTALLSAHAALAASPVYFDEKEDMQAYQAEDDARYYDGSHFGGTSGNVFVFRLDEAGSTPISGFEFSAATGAAVQDGNRILIESGEYRAAGTFTEFLASKGSTDSASGNALLVTGGRFMASLDPLDDESILLKGAAGDGDLSQNVVRLEGGRFETDLRVTAAENLSSSLSSLSENEIVLTGEALELEADMRLYAAEAESAALTQNRIRILQFRQTGGGSFGMIVAAHGDTGNAGGNVVEILDSDIRGIGSLTAAESVSDETPAAVTANAVLIDRSTVQMSDARAGLNNRGLTSGNRFVVRSSTLVVGDWGETYVFGGQAERASIVAGNVIRLEDVTLSGNGFHFIAGQAAGDDSIVRDNRIELVGAGGSIFDERLAGAHLVGGEVFLNPGSGVDPHALVRGNELHLLGWRGRVASVAAFDSIVVSDIDWTPGGTVLKIAGSEGGTDLSGTSFRFGRIGFGGNLASALGTTMRLVADEDGLSANARYEGAGERVVLNAGILEEVHGTVAANPDGHSIDLALDPVPVQNAQMALATNNRSMAVVFLGGAAEAVSDTLASSPTLGDRESGVFALVNGVDLKYASSGELNVHGFNFIAGGRASTAAGSGVLHVNLFAETGVGNYGESMRFGQLDRRVSGEMRYWGAGAAVRWSLPSGLYAEGSLRGGWVENDLDEGLLGADGQSHGYTVKSLYAGLHAGVGGFLELGPTAKLELFARYHYLHLPSDDVRVRASDESVKLRYDAVDNHRIRTGLRLHAALAEGVAAYAGAAFEYDFTPKPEVRAEGQSVRGGEPLRGATGIGELGLRAGEAGSPWTVDLRVRGYVGEREGASFRLQGEYAF